MRTRVERGSFALLASKTETTLGTTNTSRPVTMAEHMTDSTIGYISAPRTFCRISSRPSV